MTSFGTRPKRGVNGAASEEFSSLSKTFLKQALNALGTEKSLEAVVRSSTCVPELQTWKAACFDSVGHREWILETFSSTKRTMFTEGWQKFIEHLRRQRARDDNLAPIAKTVEERNWALQWMDSASKLVENNATGMFKANLKKEPDWCYETCLRLLVTVCDNLHRYPEDGYFAKLLGGTKTPAKRTSTPQTPKKLSDGPSSMHKKRPRLIDTGVANKPKMSPLSENIDVMPYSERQSSVAKQSARHSTHSSSSLGRDIHSPRSMTSSAGMFKNVLPSRRTRNILFNDSTDSDEEPKRPRTNDATHPVASAFNGLGTPSLSPDPATWKGRYLMETEKSIELVREMKKLVQERESAMEAKERAVQRCTELAGETEQLRDDLQNAVSERDCAVKELTELQTKVHAIDEIIGTTLQR